MACLMFLKPVFSYCYRKLSTENQQIKDTYEKEAKVNRRLSMENEELQWRLRQAENSIISGSFNEGKYLSFS